MFTSLLSNLQTLISTRFVVSSFFPSMAFWFAHATMLFLFNAPFHEYVIANSNLTVGLASVIAAAALVGVAFFAYAEAALLPTIQALMEGNWPFQWLISLFVVSQTRRYDHLQREIKRSGQLRGELENAIDYQANVQQWKKRLESASAAGAQKPNTYRGDEVSATLVGKLGRLTTDRQRISDRAIESAVAQLEADLGNSDVSKRGPNGHELREALDSLMATINEAGEYAATTYRSREQLQSQLTKARVAGNREAKNDYKRNDASARFVDKLADLRLKGRPIEAAQLRAAVDGLRPHLEGNNADIRTGGEAGSSALEIVRQTLWDLIDYAHQYATSRYRSLTTARQFDFGTFPLAPTRMGNVAKSVQSYAVRRYDFNFEIFWSRLQLIAQRDKDFSPVLAAAKTQLDFLISCSALNLLWALPWAIWLCVSGGTSAAFFGVALLGPLVSYIWYRVAVAQYRTVADLLRSSVDLFRFDLLAALHFAQPDSVNAEYELWGRIDGLHTRYELDDLNYARLKSS